MKHRPSRPATRAAAALLLLAVPCSLACAYGAQEGGGSNGSAAVASQQRPTLVPPKQLFEVVKVVDGDTIHIRRGGEIDKLRLLSVDTEEKLMPGIQASPDKPQTVYGQATALWARELFEGLADEEGVVRIGLRFPDGVEAKDVYGRLLCHVLLPDGTDFNLLLVEQGRSPYFNKYGNSRICHEAFVAAQRRARAAELGVWNPETNAPERPGAPSARRPYDRLLPWWQARAEAIDRFRARKAEEPQAVVDGEDPEGLAKALESGREVEVFGSVDRFFEERDGALTVLLRSQGGERALRVRIAEEDRPAHEAARLRELDEPYRQNYFYVRGTIVRGERGFTLHSRSAAQWRRAGPEPGEVAPG